MFVTKKLTREIIEQRRIERKVIKKKNRNRQPKHKYSLKHNQHPRKSFFKILFRKRRYYARKIFFTVAEKLGFVD